MSKQLSLLSKTSTDSFALKTAKNYLNITDSTLKNHPFKVERSPQAASVLRHNSTSPDP